MLLAGGARTLDPVVSYSEGSLNNALKEWLAEAGFSDLDHVTLRRYMIDAQYLHRNPEGNAYRVDPEGSGEVRFDSAVSSVNLPPLLQAAKRRAAVRKRQHVSTS